MFYGYEICFALLEFESKIADFVTMEPQGDDRTPPPLPISSDFFSTYIGVSDSGPRSLMKV